MNEDFNSSYFEWLCSLVKDSKPDRRRSYKKLMVYLYHTEFVYIMMMDGNRHEDGINLRYRFGYENGIPDPVIASCLDNSPCSVLEMMVALALRCEEHIMQDPEIGLMSGKWFWNMVTNLGLIEMSDTNFDDEVVNSIVWRFLNRGYESDGAGSLVHIRNCPVDLRNVEIWYQMMMYLYDYTKNGGE